MLGRRRFLQLGGAGAVMLPSFLDAAGFEVLLTTDKNIRYQQSLTGRKIAIVVLGNPRWPVLRQHVEQVVTAVNAAKPGWGAGRSLGYTTVDSD